jgi:saccharopine dehydrogenase (NADP+, L-glutamate forming)
MKKILLFGAGKSATSLIDYLGKCCEEKNWKLFVCDADLLLAQSKIKKFSSAEAFSFDISDEKKRHEFISKADIVVSMLPASLHFLVAKDCVAFSKNLLTPSYISDEIKTLKEEIDKKGLLFLGEMGLDPGIDHMSAMKIFNKIKKDDGKITSFKSHCGGLVAPESDNNPWHYKITWNPANVVTAGSAGAIYKNENKIIEVPYKNIFKDEYQFVDVPGLGLYSWYANRDSLSYVETYQLDGIETFLRTTLRKPAFCRGWNKIVQLGLTNKIDEEEIKDCKTFEDWFNLKKEKLISLGNKDFNESAFFDHEFLQQIDFISLHSKEKLPDSFSNSAALLQHLLEKYLAMEATDKDLIIMLHEIKFNIKGKNKEIKSCLVVKGEDKIHTAMAKTVGLPLGIATVLILEKKINITGLHIPVIPEIYEPVLKELGLNGIQFNEETTDL